MECRYVLESRVYLCYTDVTFDELDEIRNYIENLPYTVNMSTDYDCDYLHKEGEKVVTIVKGTYTVWIYIPDQDMVCACYEDTSEILANRYKRIENLNAQLIKIIEES